jgi:hypothetical protein
MTPPTTTDVRPEMRIPPNPLVGRDVESARLRQAIEDRRSLSIWGPAGIGKTALVMKVLKDLPPAVAGSTIYLSGVDGLQLLLRSLLRRLYQVGDPTLRRQLRAEGVRGGTFKAWLNSLSTSRLKGAVYRSAENGQYRIVLDHMPPLTHAVAKVVKELVQMRNTPVFLLARGLSESEIGRVADLYWSDRQRLSLGPLPDRAARDLLEWCIRRFGLPRLELEGFSELLHLSGRNPGTLIKMCALAAEPRYQHGSQIKTKLIHIDTLVNGYNSLAPPKLTERAHGGR